MYRLHFNRLKCIFPLDIHILCVKTCHFLFFKNIMIGVHALGHLPYDASLRNQIAATFQTQYAELDAKCDLPITLTLKSAEQSHAASVDAEYCEHFNGGFGATDPTLPVSSPATIIHASDTLLRAVAVFSG